MTQGPLYEEEALLTEGSNAPSSPTRRSNSRKPSKQRHSSHEDAENKNEQVALDCSAQSLEVEDILDEATYAASTDKTSTPATLTLTLTTLSTGAQAIPAPPMTPCDQVATSPKRKKKLKPKPLSSPSKKSSVALLSATDSHAVFGSSSPVSPQTPARQRSSLSKLDDDSICGVKTEKRVIDADLWNQTQDAGVVDAMDVMNQPVSPRKSKKTKAAQQSPTGDNETNIKSTNGNDSPTTHQFFAVDELSPSRQQKRRSSSTRRQRRQSLSAFTENMHDSQTTTTTNKQLHASLSNLDVTVAASSPIPVGGTGCSSSNTVCSFVASTEKSKRRQSLSHKRRNSLSAAHTATTTSTTGSMTEVSPRTPLKPRRSHSQRHRQKDQSLSIATPPLNDRPTKTEKSKSQTSKTTIPLSPKPPKTPKTPKVSRRSSSRVVLTAPALQIVACHDSSEGRVHDTSHKEETEESLALTSSLHNVLDTSVVEPLSTSPNSVKGIATSQIMILTEETPEDRTKADSKDIDDNSASQTSSISTETPLSTNKTANALFNATEAISAITAIESKSISNGMLSDTPQSTDSPSHDFAGTVAVENATPKETDSMVARDAAKERRSIKTESNDQACDIDEMSKESFTPKQEYRTHADLARELEAAMIKVWAKFDDHQAARGLQQQQSSDVDHVGRGNQWSKTRGMSMISLVNDLSIDGDIDDIADEVFVEEVMHNDSSEQAIDPSSPTMVTVFTEDPSCLVKAASLKEYVEGKAISQEVESKCETTDDEMTMSSGVYSSPMSYVEFTGSENGRHETTMTATSQEQGKRADKWSLTEQVTATRQVSTPNDSRLPFLPKLIVVDMWSSDEATVEGALEQFASLCASKSNIADFLKHGGHLSVVVVLRKWNMTVSIQAAGLLALHKAADMMEFAESVVQLGALDLVLVAMKNHSTHAGILTAGCAALSNLTVSAAHAKTLVFELQGIPVVCAACASFPTNIALQKYAVYIIQYFSYWEDFKTPIVKAGGLQTLADMVEAITANKQQRENAESIIKSAKATMKRLV